MSYKSQKLRDIKCLAQKLAKYLILKESEQVQNPKTRFLKDELEHMLDCDYFFRARARACARLGNARARLDSCSCSIGSGIHTNQGSIYGE